MYIQWCVKGITSGPGFGWPEAQHLITSETGILSNWWRAVHGITPTEVAGVLNLANLYRHLNDYDNYGPETPFISLAAGAVERNASLGINTPHSAIDTGLWFATDFGTRPGALFHCWVPVGLNPAVEVRSVAEAVRELHVYRDYLPYQLEGEVTAKVHIPANQIEKVEWWNDFTDADPVDNPISSPPLEPVSRARSSNADSQDISPKPAAWKLATTRATSSSVKGVADRCCWTNAEPSTSPPRTRLADEPILARSLQYCRCGKNWLWIGERRAKFDGIASGAKIRALWSLER